MLPGKFPGSLALVRICAPRVSCRGDATMCIPVRSRGRLRLFPFRHPYSPTRGFLRNNSQEGNDLVQRLLSLRSIQVELVLMRQRRAQVGRRSEEHTSELQSLMRISYAVFCLKKKKKKQQHQKCNIT